MRTLRVPPGSRPLRLDLFLARQLPACSRRQAQQAIAAGDVRIKGHLARKGDFVAAGDPIEVPDALFAPPQLQPNVELVVPVLYEDEAVIAVDKPAGMPSQALRAEERHTVANFLLAHDPCFAGAGPAVREAGLVHRLDTETSGVLLAARTPQAHRALRQQFSRHQVLKEYIALVDGKVTAAGTVRTPLVHDERDRRRMRLALAAERQAREAVTHFWPTDSVGKRTLLTIRIPTGVTHQIRVHLASIGHAVVGDGLYGRPDQGVPRQLLHAARLGFVHPVGGQSVEIRSPLPADFAALLARRTGARRAAR